MRHESVLGKVRGDATSHPDQRAEKTRERLANWSHKVKTQRRVRMNKSKRQAQHRIIGNISRENFEERDKELEGESHGDAGNRWPTAEEAAAT